MFARSIRHRLTLLTALVLSAPESTSLAQGDSAPAGPAEPGPVLVEPARAFFRANCVRCHGPEKSKAGLRLDALEWDAQDEQTLETWQAVLDRLAADEMPPEDQPRPAPEALEALLAAIQRAIDTVGEAPRAAGVLRRLNRVQYRNTLRDLLHIDVRERIRARPFHRTMSSRVSTSWARVW